VTNHLSHGMAIMTDYFTCWCCHHLKCFCNSEMFL
jgi:hypothetical protein